MTSVNFNANRANPRQNTTEAPLADDENKIKIFIFIVKYVM